MFKKTLLLSLLLWAAPVFAQGGPLFVWDYTDEEVLTNGIIRFEIRINGGPWADAGMTTHTPGTYEAPVPLIPDGTHLFEVRACSSTVCADVASMQFTTTTTITAQKVGHDATIVP